ncbi:hypothetical protein PENTCL1PPCAC_7041 [Pristionchus entomophagus]|uniref:TATA-binding protein-associated factor n=1 Tax=Pristionchus entomophagus TaxID=358040 RepID=A0AAV5SNB7_9BILA|nr:hypothetical protein PENTCL1PPCAC_7041 [Pristionchus entomophagus]
MKRLPEGGTLGELLQHIKTLLGMGGEKLWVCRQSALLVMKYYFAISDDSPLFETFFDCVVERLADDVDDVVSSAVTALSSLFSNASIDGERKRNFINRVMDQMWTLLHAETKRDNMRAGLDGLVVDLLTMVDTWMRQDERVSLTMEQLITIRDTMDPQFRTRTHAAVRIVSIASERREFPIDEKEMFTLLRTFYRILLFASPTETQPMLEEVYLTMIRVVSTRRECVISSLPLRESIGLWAGCLLCDHKNAAIDVFAHRVEGPTSKREDPLERMGSEEMRFMGEGAKDGVIVTRKILGAKFVAALMEILYESEEMISGQKLSTALQLLFVPMIRSSSLFHNLGAAIVINEWAALWKVALQRVPTLEVPGTVISLADTYIRSASTRQYDETSVCCASLSSDCNEFVEWCCVRGAVAEEIDYGGSVEEISRQAFESCVRVCNEEEDFMMAESAKNRYTLLCEQFEHTKMSVKANTVRVYAFLSSSLLYFGFIGEKLTPLIRPIVDVMNGERNETVGVEIFRGSIPLLIAYSQQRQPKPFVKVLSRALEAFASCPLRIPRPSTTTKDSEARIISGEPSTSKDESTASTSDNNENTTSGGGGKESEQSISSRNALLLLAVCTGFPVDQLPEFYAHFDLDEETMDDERLLTRLELHRSLFARVGSQLSHTATQRVLSLLRSSMAELRHAGAKAVETFTAARAADTMNRLYFPLCEMATNLEEASERRGAIEAIYRLSILGPSLTDLAPLLAPIAFARLADQLVEVREMAGLAFRSLLPLLSIKRETSVRPPDLSDFIWEKCRENSAFVDLLSDPGRLESVKSSEIDDLGEDTTLRHYQLEGITWLGYLRRFGLSGILADDMGLGKTLQTLAAIVTANQDASSPRPSLVVCPRTLVAHWCAEWERYFPGRKGVAVRAEGASRKCMEGAELVVAAYDELKNNAILPKIVWRYCVLDEGHILRNPRTQIFRAVSALRSETRLILSGTPVQNSSADLWALFAYLIPGFLGDERYFRQTFIKPIQQCRNAKAAENQMKDGQEALSRLHRLVLPFVLRRLKTDVLRELPEKVVSDYECTLTSLQKKVYEIIVDRCCSSPTGQRALSPLHALISLRKVVDHPSLILPLADTLQLNEDMRKQLEEWKDSLQLSGKLQALGQLLVECGILKKKEEEEEGEGGNKNDDDSVSAVLNSATIHPHRALIFCQWRASVALVSRALNQGFEDGGNGTPVSHLILDGSVAPDGRQTLVDRFNHDKSIDVMVLTTHIGGVGLNLTGADIVIFMDHDWNPMKDLQAIDRAHRLGQTRNVNVYRLITKGTIEEKVMSYQRFKKNTADALIGSENQSLSSMKTDELLSMFALEESSGANGSTKSTEPRRKKAKVDLSTSGEEVWNLSEIWDESQYDEAFSVTNFLKDTVN